MAVRPVELRIEKLDEAIARTHIAIKKATRVEAKDALKSLLRNLERRKKQLQS